MISRRSLLKSSIAGSILAGPLGQLAYADTSNDARLVIMILRGGMDGLAAVPAYGEALYTQLRRNLALPPPRETDGVLDLDGYFGLHPALDHLHSLYKQKELIVFQSVASPYRERSHFDGQDLLENGTNRPAGANDGWLNRALVEITRTHTTSNEHAMAFAQSIPLILYGPHSVSSWSPSQLPEASADLIARIHDMYSNDEFLSSQLASAIAIREFAATTGNGDRMQANLGRNNQLPLLVKMAGNFLSDLNGPRLAVFESNGWDTHANQGGAKGTLANRLSSLDEAIASLKARIGAAWSKTVVLVVTEFGRTVAVNGTNGTDHGTAGAAFMVGGAVAGGKVLADWRGLSKSSLYEGRDLYPTMDMRSIFKSVLHDHLQVSNSALESVIFPQSEVAVFLPDLVRA